MDTSSSCQISDGEKHFSKTTLQVFQSITDAIGSFANTAFCYAGWNVFTLHQLTKRTGDRVVLKAKKCSGHNSEKKIITVIKKNPYASVILMEDLAINEEPCEFVCQTAGYFGPSSIVNSCNCHCQWCCCIIWTRTIGSCSVVQNSAYVQLRELGNFSFGKMPGFSPTLERGLPPTHRVWLQGALTWKNTSSGMF